MTLSIRFWWRIATLLFGGAVRVSMSTLPALFRPTPPRGSRPPASSPCWPVVLVAAVRAPPRVLWRLWYQTSVWQCLLATLLPRWVGEDNISAASSSARIYVCRCTLRNCVNLERPRASARGHTHTHSHTHVRTQLGEILSTRRWGHLRWSRKSPLKEPFWPCSRKKEGFTPREYRKESTPFIFADSDAFKNSPKSVESISPFKKLECV